MRKSRKIAIAVLSAMLSSAPSQAQDKWFDILPGINAKNNSATVKLEGNTKAPSGQLFGKLYLDADDKSRTDFEKFFALFTATYGLENI